MKKLVTLLVVVLCLALSSPAMAAITPNGELPIVDEPTTLKVWASAPATIIDMETNGMTIWFEEQTGVHIEWIIVTDEADTKLNLSLASGDYPDMYFTSFSSPQVMLNANSGVFIPLNDLIENHSTYYKQILETDEILRENLTAPDGNIYTFYRTDAGVHMLSQNKMFVYQPWLEQYTEATGKGMPATTEEFEEMLIYFRDNDMNGNGDATDEIPLSGSFSSWGGDPIAFLMNPFQLWHGDYLLGLDDTVSFIANTDEFREGLRYINRLYEQGLIAEETYVQDTTQLKALVNQTDPSQVRVGVIPTAHVAQYVDLSIMPTGLSDYVPIPPLEGPTGLRQAETSGYNQITLYGAITSACEYPEVAMRWADYMLGGEGLETNYYGFEGEQFVWSDELSISGVTPSRTLTFTYGEPDNAWWGPYGIGPITDSTELRYSETSVYGGYGWAHYTAHEAYEPYYVSVEFPIVPWVMDEDMATEISELSILLGDYVKKSYTQFILGVVDIDDDTAWDAYKAELNNMGLERYIELSQEVNFG